MLGVRLEGDVARRPISRLTPAACLAGGLMSLRDGHAAVGQFDDQASVGDWLAATSEVLEHAAARGRDDRVLAHRATDEDASLRQISRALRLLLLFALLFQRALWRPVEVSFHQVP